MGFQSQDPGGGPGRRPTPSIRIASLAVLHCWKPLPWGPRIAAPWGFNLGWAQGLVARNPKRRIINICKAGPSDRLHFPLHPPEAGLLWPCLNHMGSCSGRLTETFLTASACLSLFHTWNREVSITCWGEAECKFAHWTESGHHGTQCDLRPASPRRSRSSQKSLLWASVSSGIYEGFGAKQLLFRVFEPWMPLPGKLDLGQRIQWTRPVLPPPWNSFSWASGHHPHPGFPWLHWMPLLGLLCHFSLS